MAGLISIDGERLRADRDDLMYSRASFLEQVRVKTGRNVSLSTLQRAEKGEITNVNLQAFCSVLGFPSAKYVDNGIDQGHWSSSHNVSGRWSVYFLENEADLEPYLSVESLFITQTGSTIRGIYEIKSSEHPEGWLRDSKYVLEGNLSDDLIFGRYYVEGRPFSTGVGVIQLLIRSTGNVAEGYTSYLSDNGDVILTKNVWIRNGIKDFVMIEKRVKELFRRSSIMKAPFLFT